MMARSFKSLFQSGFLKNMGQVASGTLVAQIAMVVSAPFLTAVFPPAAFGAFAAVVAISNILVTFASLRCDVLIPFARRQADVAAFIQIVVLGPLAVSLLLVALLALVPDEAAASIGLDSSFRDAAFLVPLAAAGVASLAAMRGLAVRQGRFSRIGLLQVIRVLVLIGASFAMGFMGLTALGIGLIAGQAFGDLVFALMLWFSLAPRHKSRLLTVHPRRILESIRTEASAVKTLSSTQAMAILYERSPPLVILMAFGPVEAGFYALAVRIAQAPATLVASAFDDVFRQRAARIWSQGKRFTQLMRNGIALTLAVSVVPLGLGMLVAPSVVEPVFGPEWTGAATTLVVMLGVAIFAFNSKSFDKVPIMLKAHRFIFAWHSTRLILELGAGLLAFRGYLDYQEWLMVVAIGRSVLYSIKIGTAFYLARTVPLSSEETRS